MDRIVLIGILSFAMLALVNLHIVPGSFLALNQTALSLFFVFFGSGYLVNAYFTDLKQMTNEISVRVVSRSVIFSIAMTVIAAMATYYAGLAITSTNIMNILFVAIVGLLVLNFFKILLSGTRRRTLKVARKDVVERRKTRPIGLESTSSDMSMLLHIFIIAAVVSIIVYLSAYLPTTEEFLQMYWDVREVQFIESAIDLEGIKGPEGLENSEGRVLYGTVMLGNRKLPIVMYDTDDDQGLDTFCLDVDEDGEWCEETDPGRNREGPIRYFETFFIDKYAYKAAMFSENRVVFINYAEYLYQDIFKTSFNVRSNYLRDVDLRITVSVDGDVISTKDITLSPGQEHLEKVDVYLGDEGDYKVAAKVEPLNVKEDPISIHFFVDRRFG